MSTITHPLTPPTSRFKFSPSLIVSILLAVALVYALSVSISKIGSHNTRAIDAQNALVQAQTQSNGLQTQSDQARAAQATLMKQLEESTALAAQLQSQIDEG